MSHPRFRNAGNAGPFTLDGTRTYRIGIGEAVLVDPGPAVRDHMETLASWVQNAAVVHVALTHGHADHAAAASTVAERVGADVYGPRGLDGVTRPLEDGDRLSTDEGELVAVHTPGHTRDHLCYHWPGRRALFAGDLVLGVGDTTWVAEYPGCVADYLESLATVRAMDLDVLYPAHGPPLTDAAGALDRFEGHRRRRIRQVEEAVHEDTSHTPESLVSVIYGDALSPEMVPAAQRSLGALLDFVKGSAGP